MQLVLVRGSWSIQKKSAFTCESTDEVLLTACSKCRCQCFRFRELWKGRCKTHFFILVILDQVADICKGFARRCREMVCEEMGYISRELATCNNSLGLSAICKQYRICHPHGPHDAAPCHALHSTPTATASPPTMPSSCSCSEWLYKDELLCCAVCSTMLVPLRNHIRKRTSMFMKSPSLSKTAMKCTPRNRVQNRVPICGMCKRSSANRCSQFYILSYNKADKLKWD